ncbi:MAG: 50S ribosomal protein L31 [Candidatus Yonathbacteria bacterium]|nr:50S ribosomal protein L31 [Candidatus Yonathbacteria bacterium]
MKTDTHPTYHIDATATCACGAAFTVGSTKKDISVEICSKCHPFYTGDDKKVLDTAGRVDKFKRRMEAATKGASKK